MGATPSDTASSGPDGSESSFECFFRENIRHIKARLKAKLWRASAADIDELTQEVFIVTHRRWDEIRVLPNPLGFVMGIANNTALEHFKEEKSKIARFGEIADVDEEESVATATASTTLQGLKAAARRWDSSDGVKKWLLPLARRPKQAEAVELRFAQGLTVEEIADFLKAPEKVVRNNSDRGIKLLRAHYGQGPAPDGS